MRQDDDVIGDLPVTSVGETLSLRTADVHSVVGGVSVPWLMKAFRMGRATVERKLIGCRPIGQGKHATPLYDLPDAAAYLIKPKIDFERLLRETKPDSLPDRLRESYWNAKLKQQRYEERAGNLWRTDRVLTLFAETLQEIRTKLTIIPDRTNREVGLSDNQTMALTSIVDEVQDDIYRCIVGLKDRQRTPNQLGEDRDSENFDDEDFI